jgi:glycosyltransferase involved in cell wall biosynthesis
VSPPISRNAACPCGSGLRYKHCCGLADDGAASLAARHERRREAGLALQERGEWVQAIEAYDVILREHPEDWDVAHMRATCLLQLDAMDGACAAFAALLPTPAADIPHFWTNIGLVLAATCAGHPPPLLRDKIAAYRRFRPVGPTPAPRPGPLPAVSVVMPAYTHERYVGEAIASVIAQTHRPLELIVIDDGSSDATADRCRAAVAHAPFRVRLITRENRGATATLNEGIELAEGEFIQLLNSDDRLPPQRIATMLAALLDRDACWGYARVAMIDRDGEALGHRADARAAELMAAQDAALMSHTRGLSLLRANSTISSGNLTLRKRLWHTLGGFRDYRYNHDWDFCLRAALECEPVLVPQVLYEYRIHGRNTITETGNAASDEMRQVMGDFVRHAHSRSEWPNAFAPTLANWGGDVLALLGATDGLRHLPRTVVERALSTRTG